MIGVAIVAVLVFADGDDSGTAELPECDESVGGAWVSFFGPNASASGTVVAEDGTLVFVVSEGRYRELDETTWEVVLATVMENLSGEVVTVGDWLYDRLQVDGFPYKDKFCFFAKQTTPSSGEKSEALVGFYAEREPIGPVRLIVEYGGNRNLIELTNDG